VIGYAAESEWPIPPHFPNAINTKAIATLASLDPVTSKAEIPEGSKDD
jgi:hypothetical protein